VEASTRNPSWKLGFDYADIGVRNALRYYMGRYKKHKDDSLMQQAEIVRLKQVHAREIHEIYKPGGYGAKQAEEHFKENSGGLDDT
jgi:hypothetical protein